MQLMLLEAEFEVMQYEFKAVNNYLKGSAIAIKSLTDVIDFNIKK
jgi:adenine specific DNA methylase Mod